MIYKYSNLRNPDIIDRTEVPAPENYSYDNNLARINLRERTNSDEQRMKELARFDLDREDFLINAGNRLNELKTLKESGKPISIDDLNELYKIEKSLGSIESISSKLKEIQNKKNHEKQLELLVTEGISKQKQLPYGDTPEGFVLDQDTKRYIAEQNAKKDAKVARSFKESINPLTGEVVRLESGSLFPIGTPDDSDQSFFFGNGVPKEDVIVPSKGNSPLSWQNEPAINKEQDLPINTKYPIHRSSKVVNLRTIPGNERPHEIKSERQENLQNLIDRSKETIPEDNTILLRDLSFIMDNFDLKRPEAIKYIQNWQEKQKVKQRIALQNLR